MTLTHRIHLLLLALILGLATSSCRQDGVDGPVDMTFTEIVTFGGSTDSGSSFSFRQVDDSPLITLTSTQKFASDDLKAGDRMLIAYQNESNSAYTSGPIDLIGAAPITTGSVATTWKDDYDIWDRDKVYLYSAWRSGEYINIHVRLTYSADPRIFTIAADPATLSSPWPELYLVHVMKEPITNHDRAYYASFSIAEIWDNPATQGVKLHVANSNLDKQIFTFPKATSTRP